MVEVMRPQPGDTLCDPACGTGGFFLAAHRFISDTHGRTMDKAQKRFLKSGTFHGWEIVDSAARLCVMNLYLHGIGDADSPVTVGDSLLEIHGRAAIVVPDNVLFEGGAGETIRRKLLHAADVHTLLRLPTGIFYAQGVKANVLFFERKPAGERPWTERLWIYDLRTNVHITLKQNPLRYATLQDFIACYRAENRHARPVDRVVYRLWG